MKNGKGMDRTRRRTKNEGLLSKYCTSDSIYSGLVLKMRFNPYNVVLGCDKNDKSEIDQMKEEEGS